LLLEWHHDLVPLKTIRSTSASINQLKSILINPFAYFMYVDQLHTQKNLDIWFVNSFGPFGLFVK
jgi:hypothetical protein